MTTLNRREFVSLAGAASALTLSSTSALAASAPSTGTAAIDPLLLVHPDLRPALPQIQKYTIDFSPHALSAARKSEFGPAPLPQPEWVLKTIPVRGGPDVGIYVVNAKKTDKPRPAILHMHGGGFITGTAKGSLHAGQELALAQDCVVVTVDYRLAPETTYVGSIEDNYAALKWLFDNADELGVDRKRIAVTGESAGGGHAALLAITARDRGEVPLAFQALVYPMLDDRTGSTREPPSHIGTLLWTRASNRFGWSSFLGVPAGSERVPKAGVPARIENLRNLPPTFIGVGSLDLFVQEDIEYANRLIEAGVPAELYVVPGAFHGFDMVPVKVTQDFRARFNRALMLALQNPA